MGRPVDVEGAPPPDVSALLAAAALAVAEHTADADAHRELAARYRDLVERYTRAAAELRWALQGADRHAADRAAAELGQTLDDARAALQ